MELVRFFYIKLGGKNVDLLEYIYISEDYRDKIIGKHAMKILNNHMKENRIISMFVDLIPRNTDIIKIL